MIKYYTQDWFSANIPRFNIHLAHMRDKENLNFLEIGSFEGRSTGWLLENVLTHDSSKIICIDTFDGGFEHKNMNLDLQNLFEIFKNNISEYQ